MTGTTYASLTKKKSPSTLPASFVPFGSAVATNFADDPHFGCSLFIKLTTAPVDGTSVVAVFDVVIVSTDGLAKFVAVTLPFESVFKTFSLLVFPSVVA